MQYQLLVIYLQLVFKASVKMYGNILPLLIQNSKLKAVYWVRTSVVVLLQFISTKEGNLLDWFTLINLRLDIVKCRLCEEGKEEELWRLAKNPSIIARSENISI